MKLWLYVALLTCLEFTTVQAAESIAVEIDAKAAPRVEYGATRLIDAIKNIAMDAALRRAPGDGRRIIVAVGDHATYGREGFDIATRDNAIWIHGGDDSGALYGCLELAKRIRETKQLPSDLHLADKPVMVLRGPCIGMQKTYILPLRKVYEYPYTPELFPFFYDKSFWSEYLDFLVENRMNSLYLWNGQPFASLVKVPGYEDAQEVDDATFAKNQEMFRWIATECDRRGIWMVQMFYSIILPKPLAEKNGLATQLAAPNPIAADYMRKAIAQFVEDYPNVGLMVCLGEALQGIDNQKQWLTEVVLPGVHEGMKVAGINDEPPIVIRTHATDLRKFMTDALAIYKNIYTEAKFNGESLTTWEPRGTRQQVHLAMSKLGSTHLINVHILANLEPFRYGGQRFIQKCVQAGRDRLGAKGVHLYPLFYWNWPDSPDKVEPPLKQWKRDWIWFEAWGRYAWNPDIDEKTDHAYWIARLTDMYGTIEAAENILAAYNDAGECAPRILRRFGITEGNRQTMSLGMTLDELVDPDKYKAFAELWESQSPPGERMQEYVKKEWNHQPHEGETPPQICSEVLDFSRRAVDEIDVAASSVTMNRDEFERLRNDVRCIRAMSQNYAAKAQAALCALQYGYSHDIADMERAEQFLSESLEHYRTLTNLTKDTYTAANSMQTDQRKIPLPGGAKGKPAYYHWTQLLPVYEKELADFHQHVEDLKKGSAPLADEASIKPLPKATITLTGKGAETYEVNQGAKVFTDRPFEITALAPELRGLTGIRFSHESVKKGPYQPIEFDTSEPVYVLVGYVKSDSKEWRKPPELETDALAAEHGGSEPTIRNAATISGLPTIEVHALTFAAGKQKLELRGEGSFIVLGVVPQTAELVKRDAHRAGGVK
jgi:hypothetical protein